MKNRQNKGDPNLTEKHREPGNIPGQQGTSVPSQAPWQIALEAMRGHIVGDPALSRVLDRLEADDRAGAVALCRIAGRTTTKPHLLELVREIVSASMCRHHDADLPRLLGVIEA